MDEALGYLDEALKKDPAHWSSSLMKARLLTHQGNSQEARNLFLAHIDHEQAGLEARLDLGLLELSDLGNPLAARDYLEPLLKEPIKTLRFFRAKRNKSHRGHLPDCR